MVRARTDYEDQMAEEIRGEIIDCASEYEILISEMRRTGEFGSGVEQLKRHVNNLRVLCANGNEHLVDLLLHRFVNYMTQIVDPKTHHIDDISVFVDVIGAVMNREIDNDTDEAEFVRSLPVFRPADLDDLMHLQFEFLLVEPNKSFAKMITRELQSCGFRVVTAVTSFEALELAARTRPDMMIVSASLDQIDGIELVRMLAIAGATRSIPVALLTSYEPGHPKLQALPKDVRIVRKGPSFADDLADLLEASSFGETAIPA
jgi:CheY-like chemotaxis protein